MKILIADDNRDITDSLALLLGVLGHEVEVAYDGIEACTKAETFLPEAAIVDIRMPGRHGYDVAKSLRALGSIRQGCMIGMTGEGGTDAKSRALESGFHHLVIKPAPLQTLLAILDPAPPGKA